MLGFSGRVSRRVPSEARLEVEVSEESLKPVEALLGAYEEVEGWWSEKEAVLVGGLEREDDEVVVLGLLLLLLLLLRCER